MFNQDAASDKAIASDKAYTTDKASTVNSKLHSEAQASGHSTLKLYRDAGKHADGSGAQHLPKLDLTKMLQQRRLLRLTSSTHQRQSMDMFPNQTLVSHPSYKSVRKTELRSSARHQTMQTANSQ